MQSGHNPFEVNKKIESVKNVASTGKGTAEFLQTTFSALGTENRRLKIERQITEKVANDIALGLGITFSVLSWILYLFEAILYYRKNEKTIENTAEFGLKTFNFISSIVTFAALLSAGVALAVAAPILLTLSIGADLVKNTARLITYTSHMIDAKDRMEDSPRTRRLREKAFGKRIRSSAIGWAVSLIATGLAVVGSTFKIAAAPIAYTLMGVGALVIGVSNWKRIKSFFGYVKDKVTGTEKPKPKKRVLRETLEIDAKQKDKIVPLPVKNLEDADAVKVSTFTSHVDNTAELHKRLKINLIAVYGQSKSTSTTERLDDDYYKNIVVKRLNYADLQIAIQLEINRLENEFELNPTSKKLEQKINMLKDLQFILMQWHHLSRNIDAGNPNVILVDQKETSRFADDGDNKKPLSTISFTDLHDDKSKIWDELKSNFYEKYPKFGKSAFLETGNVKALLQSAEMLIKHPTAVELQNEIDNLKNQYGASKQDQSKIEVLDFLGKFVNRMDDLFRVPAPHADPVVKVSKTVSGGISTTYYDRANKIVSIEFEATRYKFDLKNAEGREKFSEYLHKTLFAAHAGFRSSDRSYGKVSELFEKVMDWMIMHDVDRGKVVTKGKNNMFSIDGSNGNDSTPEVSLKNILPKKS